MNEEQRASECQYNDFCITIKEACKSRTNVIMGRENILRTSK